MFSGLRGASAPLYSSPIAVSVDWTLNVDRYYDKRAIRGFRDFPWLPLFELVWAQIGVDEYKSIPAFGQYIAGVQDGGENWTGWEFAFWEEPQRMVKIAEFANLFYASLQLTIKVPCRGNTLQQYQGLNNRTVHLKTITENWVEEYIVQRTMPSELWLYYLAWFWGRSGLDLQPPTVIFEPSASYYLTLYYLMHILTLVETIISHAGLKKIHWNLFLKY